MNAPARLLPYLLACALTTSLAGEDQDIYVNVPRDVIAQVPDITTVTKVRFFVSADLGKSWQLLKDIPVAEGALSPPRYEFRPHNDGHYLIATAASFKSGAPQADPTPGAVPANALHLVVDTFKPVVAQVSARLDHVQPDQASIAVLWSATDANFGPDPVVIEASIDNGTSWPVSSSAPAQGSQKLLVPLAPRAQSVLVRITAKDLAGNEITSDPQTVELPPPPDPAVELEKAVKNLPAVNEIPTASLLPAPVTDASTAATATATNVPGDATPAATAATPATPATPASTPDAHPDVVAPHAGTAAVSHPTDGGLISGTSFEQQYLEQSASAPSATPSAHPASAPASSATSAPATTAAVVVSPSEEGVDATLPETPAAEPTPTPTATAVAASEEQPAFLTNPAAETVLEQARAQVAANDAAAALATYHRLQSSGQAVTAIREELALMTRLGFQQMIVNTVSLLPPEFIDDNARLSEGRALVGLSKPQVALQMLSRVHAGAAEASEAMFLIARCLKDLGHPAQAKRVLKTLAAGDDDWAERARASLAKGE